MPMILIICKHHRLRSRSIKRQPVANLRAPRKFIESRRPSLPWPSAAAAASVLRCSALPSFSVARHRTWKFIDAGIRSSALETPPLSAPSLIYFPCLNSFTLPFFSELCVCQCVFLLSPSPASLRAQISEPSGRRKRLDNSFD